MSASVVLASCGGGGDIDNELSFRVIHAAPDSPAVNLLVDGVTIRPNVSYKNGTNFVFVTPRTYDFQVQAILPGDDPIIVDAPGTPLDAGREYTVIAIGKGATDSIQALIFSSPIEDIPDGNVRLQIAHAAPDAPVVDIYLTAPGADLAAATPIDQATYGNQPSARQLVPTGTYVIRITPAGVTDTVLFDSGEITLRNRDDLLLVAVQNTATGTSPISLVINNRFTNLELLDKNTTSDLRVVNLSPDAPALDVVGDPSTAASPDVTFASGITYLDRTSYVGAPPDTYVVRGVKTSDPAPATAPFSFAGALAAGQRATVLATGLLATIDDLVLTDDIRPIFASAKLRIVDGSPAGGLTDVYVVATGTDIATVDPTFRNAALRSSTPHLGFPPGNYTVTFTTAATKTVLATAEVAATNGSVQTAYLVDAVRVDAGSDGKPLSVLVLDDLAG
jgi:hypothetical protein